MKNAQLSDKTIVSKRIIPQPPARRPQPDTMRLNTAQRQTVRVALATGATIAALIGAQTLALLDRSAIVKPITLSRPDSVGNPGIGGSLDLGGALDGTPSANSVAPTVAATSVPSLDLSGALDAPATPGSSIPASKGQAPSKSTHRIKPTDAQPSPLTMSS